MALARLHGFILPSGTDSPEQLSGALRARPPLPTYRCRVNRYGWHPPSGGGRCSTTATGFSRETDGAIHALWNGTALEVPECSENAFDPSLGHYTTTGHPLTPADVEFLTGPGWRRATAGISR